MLTDDFGVIAPCVRVVPPDYLEYSAHGKTTVNPEKESIMGHTRQRVAQFIRDQRGVTGLETAIILIAFVVVASVFAFTVLSTGIFSVAKGKETSHSGLLCH